MTHAVASEKQETTENIGQLFSKADAYRILNNKYILLERPEYENHYLSLWFKFY